MIKMFNELMTGFISKPITLVWLENNPQGKLSNGSSYCNYKLINRNGSKLLGAYGVSRFTNWRYFEINEDGSLNFEWYCMESYVDGDRDSEEEMTVNNQRGFDRIEQFGIGDN